MPAPRRATRPGPAGRGGTTGATLIAVGTHGISRPIGIALGQRHHDRSPRSAVLGPRCPNAAARTPSPRSIVVGIDGSRRVGRRLGRRARPRGSTQIEAMPVHGAPVEGLRPRRRACDHRGRPVRGRRPGRDAALCAVERRRPPGRRKPRPSRRSRPRKRERASRAQGPVLGARRQASDGLMSNRLLAAGVLAAIGVGGLLHFLSQPEAGDAVWAVATAVVLVPLAWSVATKPASRRRRRRRDRARRHGGLAGARGVPGRRGRRAHARGRERSRGFGGRPRAERAQRRWSGAHLGSRTAGSATGSRRCRWRHCRVGDHVLVRHGEVVPVDGLVDERRGGSRRVGALRRSPARFLQAGSARSAAERRTPARRSSCGRRDRPRRAHTRPSSVSCARPRATRRPSFAWPIAMRPSSCPSL